MEKKFTGYLMVNWKSGKMRVLQRTPSKKATTPYDIKIKVDLLIETPEDVEHSASGKIVIPSAQYKEMVIEAIKNG